MAGSEAFVRSPVSPVGGEDDGAATSPLLPQLHREHSHPTVDLRSNRDSHLRAADLLSNVYVEQQYGTSTAESSQHRSGDALSIRHPAVETEPTSYPPSSSGGQKRKRASSSSLDVNHGSSDDSGSSARETERRTSLRGLGEHLPSRHNAGGRQEIRIIYTSDEDRIDPSRNSRVSQEITRYPSTPTTIDDIEAASDNTSKTITADKRWPSQSKIVFNLILVLLLACLALAVGSVTNTHGEHPRAAKMLLCAIVSGSIFSLTLSAYSGQHLRDSLHNCVMFCVLSAMFGVSLLAFLGIVVH